MKKGIDSEKKGLLFFPTKSVKEEGRGKGKEVTDAMTSILMDLMWLEKLIGRDMMEPIDDAMIEIANYFRCYGKEASKVAGKKKLIQFPQKDGE